MGANVFANGREISGKASDNKSIAALPDVCLSPPSPPAGPVPIPYPNTAMASNTADGSKTVQIGGKEVGMKSSSNYSKSNGDEPATRTFGANVVSHNLQGPMHFTAWSMDVQVEGENATRLGDMTTHNHLMNTLGSAGVTASIAAPAPPPPPDDCAELAKANDDDRAAMEGSGKKTYQGVAGGPTTVTNAKFTPAGGGASMSIKACSRVVASVFNKAFVKGKGGGGSGEMKTVVCGEEFTYPKRYRPLTSHTESRILETIFSAFGSSPGGTLTMAIDWNKAGGSSPDCCPDCQTLVCAAAQCMDIKLCKDGAPEKPDCPPPK